MFGSISATTSIYYLVIDNRHFEFITIFLNNTSNYQIKLIYTCGSEKIR